MTERVISLDQSVYTEGIVVEGTGSTDARNVHIALDPVHTPLDPVHTPLDAVHTSLDPGMDLSARRDVEEELQASRFPYARILSKLMFLTGITRPNVSCSVREFSGPSVSP